MCGEDVPRIALACPECGADHTSGWREDAEAYDAVDLPDEDFNYEEFVKQELDHLEDPRSKDFGGSLQSSLLLRLSRSISMLLTECSTQEDQHPMQPMHVYKDSTRLRSSRRRSDFRCAANLVVCVEHPWAGFRESGE